MTILIITIFILTIADAVCTAVGVSSGVISEGNALFQPVMHAYPTLTAVAVCLVTGFIMFTIWLAYKTVKERSAVVGTAFWRARRLVKWLPFAMVGVLLVKIYIVGMHGYWIYTATALNLW